MSKNESMSPDPSEHLLHDSILTTIESIQRQLLLIASIADLISALPASATLDSPTFPTIGAFLSDECTEILSSLEALHASVTLLLADQQE
jgi:hypothetical protein